MPASPASPARVAAPLPARAGVGLKPEHVEEILAEPPDLGFFEVHAENYMGDGGPAHRRLEAIRALYPLSLHGVGLSIGSPRPLDKDHLERLAALAERYEPGLFSEHLAWSSHDEGFLNDLLPLPYTRRRWRRSADHIDETQEALGRRMLLENPSTYVLFAESTIAETDFLAEIARRTGCGLLLDVNNVIVSATNHGFDPLAYLDAFPLRHVGEIHLAGYAEAEDDAGRAAADRRAQFAGARRRLGALRRDDPAPRADADPDRMGQRRAGLAGPLRRGAARRAAMARASPDAEGGFAMPFEATIDGFRAGAERPGAARSAANDAAARDGPTRAASPSTATMSRSALIGAIEARYPVTRRLVGDEFFRAMARAYVAEEKPRSPVLIHYGADFPDFVARFEPAREIAYLADVARLENAWVEAYHAAEAAPLALAALGDDRSRAISTA